MIYLWHDVLDWRDRNRHHIRTALYALAIIAAFIVAAVLAGSPDDGSGYLTVDLPPVTVEAAVGVPSSPSPTDSGTPTATHERGRK